MKTQPLVFLVSFLALVLGGPTHAESAIQVFEGTIVDASGADVGSLELRYANGELTRVNYTVEGRELQLHCTPNGCALKGTTGATKTSKVPAPPAPFTPTPFPNVSMCSDTSKPYAIVEVPGEEELNRRKLVAEVDCS